MHDELHPGDGRSGFVPVVFSRDHSEADFYRSLLEDYGIEVHIDEDYYDRQIDSGDHDSKVQGIAVLVDSEHLAEVEAAIKNRMEEEGADDDTDDDFYDDENNDLEDLQEFDPDKDVQ